MKVIHALQPLQKSIMLIGPTPRSPDVKSWRPAALEIFRTCGFNGLVFVPEAEDWGSHDSYDAQVHWEWEALNQATVVCCWLPRDLATMPGFTTNIEIPMVLTKLVMGYPVDAPKMRYIDALCQRHHVPVYTQMRHVVEAAIVKANTIHSETVRPRNAG